MEVPYYVVDAFTDRVFSGNPAGVCPLESWPADRVLQDVAAENNLSETAFFVREDGGFRLRWFAPGAEVDLCGHATLASAFVLYSRLGFDGPSVRFRTKSGPLDVSRRDGLFRMDFPALPLAPAEAPRALSEGLGRAPVRTFKSMDWVAVYDQAESVRRVAPDLEALKTLDGRGVIVTAPGEDCDYVLRCFGPKVGIPEDPATGSAQCMLAPYWGARLGKKTLQARQLSVRGGALTCAPEGDRVHIAGAAALYLEGRIRLP